MQVLVIGGTGRTGRLVIDELLQRGHTVSTLARNPGAIEAKPGLTVIQGTPLKIDNIRTAFQQHTPNAVIVTLNARRATDSPFAANISPPRFMADSVANTCKVMREHNVRKIVVMQAFGVGETWPNMSYMLRLLVKKSNMCYQFDDHNLVAEEIKTAGVVYVLPRPNILKDGEAEEVREWPNHGKGVPMMGKISKKSVAKFLVDAAEMDKWNNSAPVLTN
ncbi:NAD(P)-binding protein [Delitschia confertaspora ATCC 74209]|uniref:NAD(P)-binding protein n=1 Tax=Delitschia confertaspora ATCC 74209 TaxID=1513339 RepID=A0A9P4JLC6_9PLEO|nr:NAD(P)-binding protein [Delitschia confertaspora ATCC 74209]